MMVVRRQEAATSRVGVGTRSTSRDCSSRRRRRAQQSPFSLPHISPQRPLPITQTGYFPQEFYIDMMLRWATVWRDARQRRSRSWHHPQRRRHDDHRQKLHRTPSSTLDNDGRAGLATQSGVQSSTAHDVFELSCTADAVAKFSWIRWSTTHAP